jgi:hypothetical protein
VVSRRNVYPFSMAVAAHEVLQLVGVVTGLERVGGIGPQTYHSYPGIMEVSDQSSCKPGCEYGALSSQAVDLTGNLQTGGGSTDAAA